MKRIKIVIEYSGQGFVGWQRQGDLPSIQNELEVALAKVCQERISVVGSGRTDAGVNAMAQVAHFDTTCDLDADRIRFATNFYLPYQIKVVEAEVVDSDFHARFSAKEKTYIYKMYYSDYDSPLLRDTHFKLWHNIDVENMIKACDYFVGTHNFLGFCELNPQLPNTTRTIFDCHIDKIGNQLIFSITGNGFLHKMVRIIVGTIIKVGERKIRVEDLEEIIHSTDRRRAGHTAPAHALYLKEVKY